MRTAEEIRREIANHRSVLVMLPGVAWELAEIEYHKKAIKKLEEELEEMSHEI